METRKVTEPATPVHTGAPPTPMQQALAPSLVGQAVEIPANVLVACPKAAGRLTRAAQCASCEHCAGLEEDRFPGGSAPFTARFRIGCRYPVFRGLVELDEPQVQEGPASCPQ